MNLTFDTRLSPTEKFNTKLLNLFSGNGKKKPLKYVMH